MSFLVIGSGSIGKRHYENLTTLGEDCRLLPWRGLDLSALDLSGVSGLVIATATQVRLELIRLAADAGVPVYVEKPLAYRSEELELVLGAAAPIAERSVLGVMMRYHPAIRYLAAEPLEVYGFHFEIGHDVRQWRANWNFGDSYAALPDGGGVLLDLCHEIDMAHVLFPDLAVSSVDCIGHADFPQVDFATRIQLSDASRVGTVAMDYLSPESLRRMSLRGRGETLELDLLACRLRRWRDGQEEVKTWEFERNDMFLGLMRDFVALATGETPSDNPLLPRLDRIEESARLVATAYENRQFRGNLEGGFG